MFLENVGYFWPKEGKGDGIVLFASGNDVEKVLRRDPKWDCQRFLDPQLYLSVLDETANDSFKRRLMTYPGFSRVVSRFDSSQYSKTEWLHQLDLSDWGGGLGFASDADLTDFLRLSLQIQMEAGMDMLNIPALAVADSEDGFTLQKKWLDAAMSLKADLGKPMYASLILPSHCLEYRSPEENVLLQTIIDNLQVINELDGVYAILLQDGEVEPQVTSSHVLGAFLKLSYDLGVVANKQVLINFMDVFGFVCLGAGASGFATGYFSKDRQLTLDSFSQSGGRNYPRFYSHALGLDLRIEKDLERIVHRRLFRMVSTDETVAAKPLFNVLSRGAPSSGVPDWADTQNNVSAAKEHRIELLARVTREIDALPDLQQKAAAVLTWLQDAHSRCLLLESEFDDDPLTCQMDHIGVWRKAFEEFTSKKGL